MPKTISQLVTDFQTLTNDSSTSSGTLAKTLINFGVRSVLGAQNWTFNKTYRQYSSATSIQSYEKPYDAFRMESVHYWDSNVWYALKEVRDDRQWRILNNTVVTGLPYSWFISTHTGHVELYPIPSDSKGTIRMNYLKKVRDIGVTDYSTGSVTATSGGTAFTGAGTAWGTLFAGRSISVSGTDTPIDGYWFEIDRVNGVGTIEVRESIPNAVNNATYKISELIPLPDGFEDIPLWYALDRYYQIKEKPVLAREYERKYKEQLGELQNRDMRSASNIIEKQYEGEGMMNPNSNPWSITLS
jgi:hypothetical protein